jgi:DNA-binding NarL/FixJ family response regulator
MPIPIASRPMQVADERFRTDLVRVLLVDDSPPILDALAAFLRNSSGLDVLDMVTSGERAVERVRELEPDLVLMDISMPGMGGLEATRQIKALPDAPRVVFVSINDYRAYRDAARSMGGDAFVSKCEISDQLMPAIENLFPERMRNWHEERRRNDCDQ